MHDRKIVDEENIIKEHAPEFKDSQWAKYFTGETIKRPLMPKQMNKKQSFSIAGVLGSYYGDNSVKSQKNNHEKIN